MVDEREIRRKLQIAAGLVIGVTILWAFLFVPRPAGLTIGDRLVYHRRRWD